MHACRTRIHSPFARKQCCLRFCGRTIQGGRRHLFFPNTWRRHIVALVWKRHSFVFFRPPHGTIFDRLCWTKCARLKQPATNTIFARSSRGTSAGGMCCTRFLKKKKRTNACSLYTAIPERAAVLRNPPCPTVLGPDFDRYIHCSHILPFLDCPSCLFKASTDYLR